MSSTTTWYGLGYACLLACVVGQAHATPAFSASASIEGLSYRLIDLDPNDGITPSLTFIDTVDGMQATNLAAYRSNFISTGWTEHSTVRDSIGGSPLSMASGGVSLQGEALAAANKQIDGLSSSVGASAEDAASRISAAGVQSHISFDGSLFSVGSSASSKYGPYFELSPQTLLVIDGMLRASVAVDPYAFTGTAADIVARELDVTIGTDAASSASFVMKTFLDPDNRFQTTYFSAASLSTYAVAGLTKTGVVTGSRPLTDAQEKTFHMELSNSSDGKVLGAMSNYAQSSASLSLMKSTVTPPVPEPSALWLSALGLLGLLTAARLGRNSRA